MAGSSDFKSGFRALSGFSTKLKQSDRLLLAQSAEMKPELLKLVDEGFDERKDPVGRRWKRRKKAYPWPILNKTLLLRKSWRARQAGRNGVYLTNPVYYAVFHQRGTRKMVARKMVPDQSLSPKWRSRLMKVWSKTNGKYWGFT